MHVVRVSGVMTLVAFLFGGAFKDRTNMWFPLIRQEVEKKEVRKGLKGKQSDQWRKVQQ